MEGSTELQLLRNEILDTVGRILDLLQDEHMFGQMSAGFISKARAVVRVAIFRADITADELRTFGRGLVALEDEIASGILPDRAQIVKRIEGIYYGIWQRKLGLETFFERTWGFNLGP
jgi:hypothetical protein